MNIRSFKICLFIGLYLCFKQVRCQILISNTENACSSYIYGIDVRENISDMEKRLAHTELLLSSAIGAYGPGVVDVYEKSTLLFSREKLSWNESQSFCQQFSASLIHSIDEKINDYLKKKLVPFNSDFWIGGLRESNRSIWVTPTGEDPITWTDWADGEPTGNGECIQMWSYKSYHWDDDKCEIKKKFICAKRNGED